MDFVSFFIKIQTKNTIEKCFADACKALFVN